MNFFWKSLLVVVICSLIAIAVFNQRMRFERDIGERYSQRSATSVANAVEMFLTEYGRLPDVGERVTTDSEKGIELLNILAGLEEENDQVQNPRRVRFLSIQEVAGNRGGVVHSPDGKSIRGLFDKHGRPFTVVLDTDMDKILRFRHGAMEIELEGRAVLVFSAGADGKYGTGDDILTW